MSSSVSLPNVTTSRHRDREVWIGAFVILGAAAILVCLLTMTDAALFRGRYIVHTVVADAGGIRRGDAVQMRGVNIGRVTSFDIGLAGVSVALEIEGEYPIPADSRVHLRSAGMLGGMVADIAPGASSEEARRGDVLPGGIDEDVLDQLDGVQQQATQALTQVQRLLDGDMIDSVHDSGANLETLLDLLGEMAAEQRGELAALSGSLRRSAEIVERSAQGLEAGGPVARAQAIVARMDSATATLDRAAATAERLLSRIDAGEGTLGKLSTDAALYDRASESAASVTRAADELARLAADVRARPERYVRVSVF